jgi:hypothetical protein
LIHVSFGLHFRGEAEARRKLFRFSLGAGGAEERTYLPRLGDVVYTENLIRVDGVTESPKLAE